MKSSNTLALAALLLMAIIGGCSQWSSPTQPVVMESTEAVSDDSHTLLGLYTFVCKPETERVEIVPLRDADLHLNALKFLEPPVNLYLHLDGPVLFNGNIIDLNIMITHPFLGLPQHTGFDVCGIVITHGSLDNFYDPDIVMAGLGDTRLLNTDGYSRWWNPAEFPHGKKIFNYIDGLLGTPATAADFNSTINGYKFFADGLGVNDPVQNLNPAKRAMFSEGQELSRHYKIDMSGGLIFNYAVDACWKKPLGSPPYMPPECFPPEANRPEAYNISVSEIYNTLYYDDIYGYAGGNMKLRIDVWDHFNGQLNQVFGESADGLDYVGMTAPMGGNEVYSTYELDFNGCNLSHGGIGQALITVQSEKLGYGDVLQDKPLCAYFTHAYEIASEAPAYPDGWARTWGGIDYDWGHGVAIDGSGNVYITGWFDGTVDFDPGPGVDEHHGGGDFLSKFDSNGDFQWARTWTLLGDCWHFSSVVAVDGSGNAYVMGNFMLTVDFDPGPGVDEHTSNGSYDVFLSKFDSSGDFHWACTWGGGDRDVGHRVAIDGSDNTYITGEFSSYALDFDPGPGVDEHISNGGYDIFLSKFDSAGDFQWARTWGGDGWDQGIGVAVDESDNACVTGNFMLTVDFDPGPGVDEHTSNGHRDVFLSKIDSSGDFQWARTWGGESWESGGGIGVAVDGSGNAYIMGGFNSHTVDFDPGPGVDEHASNGMNDIFLSKFDSAGDFQWARTWGGSDYDSGHGVAIDGSSNTYITGGFSYTVDFDPGPGVDEHTSNGYADIFLSKIDSSGDFQWARTWGGGDFICHNDYGQDVAIDGSGNAYVTGFYQGTVDFDPGPGVDEHTTNGHRDVFLSKFLPEGDW